MTDFYLRGDKHLASRCGESVLDGSIELPFLLLKQKALEHNIDTMQRFCNSRGVVIAPHVKTTMCPFIISRQVAAGAWAVTVATMQQLRVCLEMGISRILLANELVNPRAAEWLGNALQASSGQEVYCLVDSVEGASLLSGGLAASSLGRPLPVLLEVGVPSGRAGCRAAGDALEVARRVGATDNLVLAGVESFEAVGHPDRSSEELAKVDGFLNFMLEIAEACVREGLIEREEVVLSAGGSKYFDRVVEVLGSASLGCAARVVLRSGCYVTHDHGNYGGPPPLVDISGQSSFRPALELWSQVISVPQPGEAIAGFGLREAGLDVGLPVPLARRGIERPDLEHCEYALIRKLNDQHAYVDTSAGPDFLVGDWLMAGVVHPCTVLDRWRSVLLVDDHYGLLDVLATCF